MNCWCRIKSSHLSSTPYPQLGRNYEPSKFPSVVPAKFILGYRVDTRVFATKNSVKKSRKSREAQKIAKPQPNDGPPDEYNGPADKSSQDDSLTIDNLEPKTPISIASRSSVLQACTLTSGLLAALGLMIRQVSHLASTAGWPIIDCSTDISINFEMWHLELTTGLVILISASRLILLNIWPDFAESSEASNRQVLTSLEPLDYAVVAFLPGISEELLFRGALLPLFGINLKSALAVAALFGILHLGSGRKYSFAVWASFVGFAYGYATIVSSSLLVPMASHAINNLIGGAIWRMTHQIHQKR